MGNKICSFFGHREVVDKENVYNQVLKLVENLIVNEDFSIFLFGGYGEFDDLCRQCVSKLKEQYTDIEIVYCYSDEKQFFRDKRNGTIKNSDYDRFEFLSLDFNYWYTRIYYRNCEMVNKSHFVIFYAQNKKGSGAYKIYEYAIKTKKSVKNIFMEQAYNNR